MLTLVRPPTFSGCQSLPGNLIQFPHGWMAPIRMVNVAKAFRGLAHQIAALEWLDQHLDPAVKAQFEVMFRADPPVKPEASPSSGVDWMTPALAIVQQFEGCRLTAYPDPGTGGAPWTIGWGSTSLAGGIPVKSGDTITQIQADQLLNAELNHTWARVMQLLPVAHQWSGVQQAAIVSFAYNIGTGALESSTLRRRLIAGEDPSTVVREELPRWNKGGSGVMQGLVRRRAAEVALFCGAAPPPPGGAPVWPGGLVGPKIRPPMKPGDHHLIANDKAETLTAYDAKGNRLWIVPCLCRGQGGEAEWNTTGSDTPPGLYRVGTVYRDYEQEPSPRVQSRDRMAYGWFSLDLIGLEGQEGPGSSNGRDGVMIHGGGSACGWPGAWAPLQPLHPTLGCIRCHNLDMKERILPLLTLGTVWVSVLQEAA